MSFGFFPTSLPAGSCGFWPICWLRPAGNFSLGRAILTVFLIGLANLVSSKVLNPLIGDGWGFLVDFVVSTLIVKTTLDLTFRRSVVAVLIYWLFWLIVVLAVSFFGKAPKPKAALAPSTVASLTQGRSVIPSRT